MLADGELMAFVSTTDLDRSRAFYEGVLGLALIEATPFANVFRCGAMMLRVTRADAMRPAPYTVLGWIVEDIEREVRDLVEAGVIFLRYDGMPQDDAGIWTTPNGDRVAWFPDVDDNVLSLTQFILG